MHRIVSINTCNFGSTGNMMLQLKDICSKADIETVVCYPKSRSNLKKKVEGEMYIGSILERNLHLLLSNFTGLNGCFSLFCTLRFLHRVSKLSPDIIHLHNLHNSYINLPLLFSFIKHKKIPVVWTFHDCWPITGRCPHFTLLKCDKWKVQCRDCPYSRRDYPASVPDRTETMWKLKKKWFSGVENMTIVTPSEWLAELVGQSYLQDYPIKVINNGIDLKKFKPMPSDFREKHNLQNKYLVLGVSFEWGYKKGLDAFVDLSKRLGENYRIVLVGTNEQIEHDLPDNVISIRRTQDQKELAEIYTAADVFVNATREENYPTVNMEALACGTPIVTFKTGGSPEILDESCGAVVACDDLDGLEKNIVRICEQKPYTEEACLKRAGSFNTNKRFNEYLNLYNEIFERKT